MSTKLVRISRLGPRVDPAARRAASSSWTAKMYWSVRPRTKTGMLMPSSEMTVTAPSDQPWAWRAA